MEPNNDFMKEVDFEKYYRTCKHEHLDENEEPCYECLHEPARAYSHKPARWEES